MDVDFYTLERPVQDRFADATRSIGLPAPLVREAARDHRALFWFVASAAFTAALVVLVSWGFGNLKSTVALPPLPLAAGYGVLVALSLYCALRGLSIRGARRTLPYEPGLYLFPAGVYDARGERIRAFRGTDIRGVEIASGTGLRVRAEGVDVVFRFPSADMAEKARAALEEGRRQYGEALRAENRREQARFDPLVDSGFSSPFSPQFRISKMEPLWAKLAIAVALGAGVVIGPAVWKVRSFLGERRLYATVVARNDVEGYRAYLARGGVRKDIADILLPRAELRAAASEGTVEALERYQAAHPGSKIHGEVTAALQAAVRREFESARAAGTVSALRAFRSARAGYAFIGPAVEAAQVALHRKVLRDFSTGKDPAVASFFERLLGYTKGHGPEAAVTFVRKIPESATEADGQVKRSAYFMGKESVPSQYFIGDYAARREETAGKALIQALGKPFPADMLDLRPGSAITDPGSVPAATAPTLYIEYMPEMAGGYMSPKPRGVFVGVGMMFKASFQIPGDTTPLEIKFSLWRTPNPQILKGEGTTVADVYEKMASDGFERFVKDFLAFIEGKKE